jgi:two-component system, NarL family, nitrate/nitrite response regulator NarL
VKPIRLVVVDDHVLFRRGLIGLLADMNDFKVVGEAGSGEDALRVIPKTNPDIVLLDVNMPGLSGVETLRAMREAGQKMSALMLTVSQDENDLVGAIMAGASGYLLKNAEPEMLRRTLLDVAEGKSVLSPEITVQVLKLMRRSQSSRSHDLVSGRELDVLRCLARGLTTTQIAAELYISENTVKTHIRHVLEKMEVNNRAEAVAKALQAGLI